MLSLYTIPLLLFYIMLATALVSRQPHRVRSSALFEREEKKNRKQLTASEWARREEEKRKRERSSDVVIGKTSAVPGEENFSIDFRATEEEYIRQATAVEKIVYQKTQAGLDALKLLNLEDANEYFEAVLKLKPDAYLWQAGIAKYYLGDYEEAARIFAQSAIQFESKFMQPATEERIWRNACELKVASSLTKKESKRIKEDGDRQTLLTEIPEDENTRELLSSEMRIVHRIAQTLFEASVKKDVPKAILCRARLQSISGGFQQKKLDIKMRKLHSWFYLGLHYDAIGDEIESKKCMKMAIRLCPSGNGDDIVQSLPMLHMARRNWFDDDDDFSSPLFEEKPEEDTKESKNRSSTSQNDTEVDPVVTMSIKKSVEKLKHSELQDALRLRGLKVTGSKAELQERLFYSLLEDTGLAGRDAGFAP